MFLKRPKISHLGGGNLTHFKTNKHLVGIKMQKSKKYRKNSWFAKKIVTLQP